MKKILLSLLILVVALGLLAGAGFLGYRLGYDNGTTSSGHMPAYGRYHHTDPENMPGYGFGKGSDRGSGPSFGFNNHLMMRPGGFNIRGFNYFSPLHLLWNIALLGLVIWFGYWLITKSGWQITRKSDPPKEEGN